MSNFRKKDSNLFFFFYRMNGLKQGQSWRAHDARAMLAVKLKNRNREVQLRPHPHESR
jgi:hypothetical protein